MRKLFQFLVLAALASGFSMVSDGATITFTVTNSLGVASTNLLRIWPVSTPINANGSWTISGVPSQLQLTNGVGSIFLLQGDYLATDYRSFNFNGPPWNRGPQWGDLQTYTGYWQLFAVPQLNTNYNAAQPGIAISGGNIFNYTPGVIQITNGDGTINITSNGMGIVGISYSGAVPSVTNVALATNALIAVTATNATQATNWLGYAAVGPTLTNAINLSGSGVTNFALTLSTNSTNYAYGLAQSATNTVLSASNSLQVEINPLAPTNSPVFNNSISENGVGVGSSTQSFFFALTTNTLVASPSQFTFSGTNIAPAFVGDGSRLSNLSGINIATNTITSNQVAQATLTTNNIAASFFAYLGTLANSGNAANSTNWSGLATNQLYSLLQTYSNSILGTATNGASLLTNSVTTNALGSLVFQLFQTYSNSVLAVATNAANLLGVVPNASLNLTPATNQSTIVSNGLVGLIAPLANTNAPNFNLQIGLNGAGSGGVVTQLFQFSTTTQTVIVATTNQFTFSGTNVAPAFVGDGSRLTNLSLAANITGTITNNTTGNAANATNLNGVLGSSYFLTVGTNTLVQTNDARGITLPNGYVYQATNLVGTATNNITGNAAFATNAGSAAGLSVAVITNAVTNVVSGATIGAVNGNTLTNINGPNIVGGLTNSVALATNVLNATNVPAGAVIGAVNGNALTNLNASKLTGGPITNAISTSGNIGIASPGALAVGGSTSLSGGANVYGPASSPGQDIIDFWDSNSIVRAGIYSNGIYWGNGAALTNIANSTNAQLASAVSGILTNQVTNVVAGANIGVVNGANLTNLSAGNIIGTATNNTTGASSTATNASLATNLVAGVTLTNFSQFINTNWITVMQAGVTVMNAPFGFAGLANVAFFSGQAVQTFTNLNNNSYWIAYDPNHLYESNTWSMGWYADLANQPANPMYGNSNGPGYAVTIVTSVGLLVNATNPAPEFFWGTNYVGSLTAGNIAASNITGSFQGNGAGLFNLNLNGSNITGGPFISTVNGIGTNFQFGFDTNWIYVFDTKPTNFDNYYFIRQGFAWSTPAATVTTNIWAWTNLYSTNFLVIFDQLKQFFPATWVMGYYNDLTNYPAFPVAFSNLQGASFGPFGPMRKWSAGTTNGMAFPGQVPSALVVYGTNMLNSVASTNVVALSVVSRDIKATEFITADEFMQASNVLTLGSGSFIGNGSGITNLSAAGNGAFVATINGGSTNQSLTNAFVYGALTYSNQGPGSATAYVTNGPMANTPWANSGYGTNEPWIVINVGNPTNNAGVLFTNNGGGWAMISFQPLHNGANGIDNEFMIQGSGSFCIKPGQGGGGVGGAILGDSTIQHGALGNDARVSDTYNADHVPNQWGTSGSPILASSNTLGSTIAGFYQCQAGVGYVGGYLTNMTIIVQVVALDTNGNFRQVYYLTNTAAIAPGAGNTNWPWAFQAGMVEIDIGMTNNGIAINGTPVLYDKASQANWGLRQTLRITSGGNELLGANSYGGNDVVQIGFLDPNSVLILGNGPVANQFFNGGPGQGWNSFPTNGITIANPNVAGAAGTGNLLVTNVSSLTGGQFNGNGAGLTNLSSAFKTTFTNWVIGQINTNSTGRPWLVSSDAQLTIAAVAGNVDMLLEVSDGNGHGRTNTVGMQSTALTIAMVYTNGLNGIVPTGYGFTFTNRSGGAGNSSALVPQSGTLFDY